jgi:hypothetical protein
VLAYRQEGAYLPTARAVARSGLALPVPRLQPELTRHFHDMTVADVADWLLTRFPGAAWETERELRRTLRRAGRPAWPLPDGVLVLDGGRGDRMAVEVDLTQRDAPAYARKVLAYCDLVAAGEYARVQWFTRLPGTVRAIERAIQRSGDSACLRVRLLPPEVMVYGR